MEREAGGEGTPPQGLVTMMESACQRAAHGDLTQTAIALAVCETIALDL
ncbi:hypothetical protein GCM10009647_065010 [Streptomyces sanglieri]|uniref:Uncharacterized protein n=1 Tax=Streptomyces sanglieri TaxID=193460 RepID=A0ABW2XDS2_9ACTN